MIDPTGLRQRLAAILAADAAGYSRLMAQDERATVAALDAARALFRTSIETHQGRVIDMAGDSVLAVFETAAGAVSAALEVQPALDALATGVPADRRMRFRIGVHLGDVIEKADGSVYGDGVNIAARLEGLALPGGITISDAVQGAVRNRIAASFEDLGEQQVKNIVDPVRAFRVHAQALGKTDSSSTSLLHVITRRISPWRWWALGLPVAVLISTLGAYWMLGTSRHDAGEPALLSVAVLPFKSPRGASDERFAEEFTRALTAALGTRLRGSTVVSASTADPNRAAAIDMRAIGKELNVRFLVAGEIRREDGQIAIDAQVINAQSRAQLWSGRIQISEAKLKDSPGLHVGRATRATARVIHGAEERRISGTPVRELGAMELVIRADAVEPSQNFLSPEVIRKISDLCDSALRLDPGLADAMICKADALVMPWDQIGAEFIRKALDEADDLTTRAVALAPNYSGAWGARSVILRYQKKWEAAFEANARAIQLDPFGIGHLTLRAQLMVFAGRPEEVFAATAPVLELDPAESAALHAHCEAYVALGRFDDAIVACEKSAVEDFHWKVHIALAVAYAQTGNQPKASAARDKAIARQPGLTIASFRASNKLKADHPRQWEQFDKYWVPGLRKAGFAEK